MRNGFCFLTDRLPTTIGNLMLDTRTSTAVAVMLKFRSDEADDVKALYSTMKLFHLNYDQALEQSKLTSSELDRKMVEYLLGAPEVKSWKELHSEADASDSEEHHSVPDFDFVQDSGAIISAFRQVYHLSLDEVCDLHWWEFLELFHNLPPEGSMFSFKRSIRTRKPDPNATPEQKKALRDAKRSVRLKDTRSPEQKEQDRQAMFNALDL